jgi:hypothetical protein
MNTRCPNANTEPCAYPACGCHTPTRPQNCGTGHCSCIECPFEPPTYEAALVDEPETLPQLSEALLEVEHWKNVCRMLLRTWVISDETWDPTAEIEKAMLRHARKHS